MLSGPVIVAASALYLLLLFAVAYFGDKRADAGTLRALCPRPTPTSSFRPAPASTRWLRRSR